MKVWRIAAGVFIGIIAAIFFFSLIASGPNQGEEWRGGHVATMTRAISYEKGTIKLAEGMMFDAEVSNDGKTCVIYNGEKLIVPNDAILVRKR
jgi:hypothetical protein